MLLSPQRFTTVTGRCPLRPKKTNPIEDLWLGILFFFLQNRTALYRRLGPLFKFGQTLLYFFLSVKFSCQQIDWKYSAAEILKSHNAISSS